MNLARSTYPRLFAWFFVVFALAPASFAQDTEPVVFTLVNGTSATIVEFYATDPGSGEWQDDILGVEVLAPEEAVEITIDDFRDDCKYDFLAVFSDGTELVHEDVAVCDDEEYVYTDD